MKTQILEIYSEKDILPVARAADILNRGDIVVFPTETVYGIGADATNAKAVDKIFSVKQRPKDNPLIVHIGCISLLSEIVETIPSAVMPLLQTVWPGPLTIILKARKGMLPDNVRAGLDTVAIRMPNHPAAMAILKQLGKPVAAPSANISGTPSATRFEHVLRDFEGKVAAIVKSIEPVYGLESTVVDVTHTPYMVMRPGEISAQTIQQITGIPTCYYDKKTSDKPSSPGMKYKHYAPHAKVFLMLSATLLEQTLNTLRKLYKCLIYPKSLQIEHMNNKNILPVAYEGVDAFKHNIYHWFRMADENKCEAIVVLLPEVMDENEKRMLLDRLTRAATEIVP